MRAFQCFHSCCLTCCLAFRFRICFADSDSRTHRVRSVTFGQDLLEISALAVSRIQIVQFVWKCCVSLVDLMSLRCCKFRSGSWRIWHGLFQSSVSGMIRIHWLNSAWAQRGVWTPVWICQVSKDNFVWFRHSFVVAVTPWSLTSFSSNPSHWPFTVSNLLRLKFRLISFTLQSPE